MTNYSVKLCANFQRVDKEGYAAIYLRVIINREVKLIPLNLKWDVNYFDKQAGKLLPRQKKDPDLNDYLLIINNEILKVNEVFKIYRIQDRVLDMKTFLFEINNVDVRKDFIEYMKHQLKLRLQYKQIDLRTHKNGMGTVNRLIEFKGSLPFYMLTDKFLTQFANWLRTKHNNAQGMVWSRIKDIKTYIAFAENDDISIPKSCKKYKNTTPKASLIYLENDEIDKLVKLFNSKRLLQAHQHVLAAFLFSCFTGLRISDIQRANYGWFTLGNQALKFMPHKNRRFNRFNEVPVGNIARGFIINPTGYFFDLPTDQEINRTLKDIAKEAEVKTKITFHVARHTFGTHYYRQTKDVVSLQKILGHGIVATTMIYVHINETDKAKGIDTMNKYFEENSIYLRVVS